MRMQGKKFWDLAFQGGPGRGRAGHACRQRHSDVLDAGCDDAAGIVVFFFLTFSLARPGILVSPTNPKP